jgi:hypothetical protein
MTPAEITSIISSGSKLLSDGLLQLREYNTKAAVQDKSAKATLKAQNIADMVNLVGACLPGGISIVRELVECYRMLTDAGVEIPSAEEFAQLVAQVEALPRAQDMKLPADVQAIIDAQK